MGLAQEGLQFAQQGHRRRTVGRAGPRPGAVQGMCGLL
ncbi:hypothetical protein NH44784_029601 [Achromobacter xylosoxidans NH44784-1996]|nr:hypothetical protein NH44784_029601 [Achromobacter xylosoxidans NH44784-1996]